MTAEAGEGCRAWQSIQSEVEEEEEGGSLMIRRCPVRFAMATNLWTGSNAMAVGWYRKPGFTGTTTWLVVPAVISEGDDEEVASDPKEGTPRSPGAGEGVVLIFSSESDLKSKPMRTLLSSCTDSVRESVSLEEEAVNWPQDVEWLGLSRASLAWTEDLHPSRTPLKNPLFRSLLLSFVDDEEDAVASEVSVAHPLTSLMMMMMMMAVVVDEYHEDCFVGLDDKCSSSPSTFSCIVWVFLINCRKEGPSLEADVVFTATKGMEVSYWFRQETQIRWSILLH